MTTYIGTPTSRYDGRAKVTGAAKYAGEYNTPGLVHGFVVASTIPRGRIARIDAGEALRVPGVLADETRPAMAKDDASYKDEVAPDEGKPFRPLYSAEIQFSEQPVALVLAEDPDVARFAATLVRVTYEKAPFSTDLEARRDQA